MAGKSTIVPEVHNGVSTLDEPSAAWGWHDIGRGPIQIAGWISVLFLLAYNLDCRWAAYPVVPAETQPGTHRHRP